MPTDTEFHKKKNGNGFCAWHNGRKIGEINIVQIGSDRLIIESTNMDSDYADQDLCMHLVKCVAQFARTHNRKVIIMCPRAQNIFNRYPEFDDVRLIRN